MPLPADSSIKKSDLTIALISRSRWLQSFNAMLLTDSSEDLFKNSEFSHTDGMLAGFAKSIYITDLLIF